MQQRDIAEVDQRQLEAADPAPSAPSDSQTYYPLLWYTSNTPISVGQRDCAMERYLGYHAGPHGTGWRRKAQAIPLVTGGSVHTGVQLIGEWILEWQTKNPNRRLVALPDAVTAWAAVEAAEGYERKARAKGLALSMGDVDAAAAMESLILEQRTLIEALVWIYAIARLPVMLSQYRLLDVEREEAPVLDCTCGLGDWVGQAPMHAQRGCSGIVAQGRADLLWETPTNTVIYEEVKTKASERKSWEDAWEHAGQLFLNMEAASRRLGREVNEAFVPVLFKGWRGRDRNAPPTEPKYQHSPLVYGWFKPGNGMTIEPDASARYTWYDDYGQKHTLGSTYKRTPIWKDTIDLATLPNPNGAVFREGASRVEQWIRGWVLPGQFPEFLKTLGPFPRPRGRVPMAEASLKAEERLWRERVEYLRELWVYGPEHPEVVELIPRSWNCTHYDGTPCQFKTICDQEPGWQDIASLGTFDVRTPHHLPEKEAFEACGVVFPEDEDGEDESGDE